MLSPPKITSGEDEEELGSIVTNLFAYLIFSISNKPSKKSINFSIEGKFNFILLLGVILSVIFSGLYQNTYKP